MDPFFEKNLITTKEAGELFGYTSDYLARLARGGKIAGKRIGHTWLVDTESLTRFLSQQEDRKADYARTLAREREAEYRKHHSILNDVSKTLSKPLPVSPLIEKLRLMVPQAVALSAATLVVTSGMFLAHAAPLASFAAEAALIAREAVVGFDATFGDIPARFAARVDTVEKDARAISPRVAVSTTRVTARVASPTLIALQAELRLPQQRSRNSDFRDDASAHRLAARISETGYAQPARAPEARAAFDARAFVRGTLALLVSPTQLQDSLARGYRVLGETCNRAIHASLAAYGASIRHAGAGALTLAATSRDSLVAVPRFFSRAHLASGSAIIGVTHAAIRAEVAAAYGLSAALPAAGQGATALMLGTGDALATATADTVVRTPVVLARALHAFSEAGPTLAQAVFSAEYAAAAPFVRGAHAISGGYLAAVTTAGRAVQGGAARSTTLARATRSIAARAPAALEDSYLGALGKSALALDTIVREPKVAAVLDAPPVRALRGYGEAGLAAVAPALSISERAALATYRTIRDFFDSANRALATLVGPAPSIVIPSGIPKPRVITVTQKTKLPSETPSSAPSVSYPSYTTVVRGVSEEYVSQSLASLRGDVLATVSGMIQPVRTQVITNATTIQQVNKIEDLSNLIVRNGDFRGSIFDSGIRVSATNGNFNNLTSGTTTLATTTITGSLALTGDQTITGSLTISALTVTGSLSTSGSLTGGSIIASSATATSTFAGSLNVDSGGFVYATSTRNVGIGVLSPAALLAIQNSTSTQPIFVASNAAGAEVYRITNAGFVGIGTTSPTYALAVEGSSTLGNQAIAGYFTATTTTDSTFPNLVATNSTTTNATTTRFYSSALVAGDATSTNLYASDFTAGNATSTYAYAATASSTNLFATAARFATLVVDGLSTFGGGFLANASSTITSGLFTMGGGASTTNLTASGTGYFGSLGGAAFSSLTANYLPKWNSGTWTNSLVSDDSVRISFPYASTTQLSAYGSLAVGGTATTSIVGDYNASSLRGALTVYGNTTSGSASSLTLQRGSTNGDNTLAFNDQTGSPLLKLYTSANTGYSYLTGYQSYLSLGTSAGGESLRIDTSDNIDLTAHLLPTVNQQYDLGSPARYWRNAYINNIVANNLSSASTSIAGTNTTSFSINSNNPTVDTQDMSLIFYRGAGAPSNAVFSWNSTLKRFEFNQNAYITNATASIASTTLRIAGVAGQTAPLTAWLDSNGDTLASISAAGAFSAASLGLTTALPVTSGGTGWAAVQANALLYGNGTGALATTTQGTGGQTLAWSGGAPAWVATTTFSSGLTYASGNVTNTGLLSLAQTYGTAQTGALTVATSSDTNILLNITNTGGAFTFTPAWTGTLADDRIANSTNWNTAYTNRITSASFPLAISANAISFNGLSTSTAAVVGNIPYFSSANQFANVATSSLSLGLGLSGSNMGYLVGGSAPSLAIATSSLYSGAANALPYFTGINTLGSINAGTNGYVLGMSGGTPTWVATTTIPLAGDVGGTLSATTIGANKVTLGMLATLAANSVIGNLTGSLATPTAVATSSLFSWTGTGLSVRDTSPTLTTPNLGTPSALTLTNASGLPSSGMLLTKGNFLVGNDAGTAQATSTIFISSTGNVGIGTADPGSLLHLYKSDATAYTSDFDQSYNLLKINNPDTTVGSVTGIHFLVGTNREAAIQAVAAADGRADLVFGTRGGGARSEKMRINSYGNVGIGTTTPYSRLSVWGADTGANIMANFVNSASTSVMSILNNGNVGIGTTNPAYKLAVNGDIKTTSGNIYGNGVNDGGANDYYAYISLYDGSTGNLTIANKQGTDAYGNILFNTNSSERLRISNGGNVGIGTTDPNEGKVEVKGGSVCVDTDSNGTATSCIANESDARLKTNVLTISGEDALAKLAALRGVSFDWRYDDPEVLAHYPLISRFAGQPHSVGLIAQEVQSVLPEAILQETVGDAAVQYLQLDYTKLVPLLVSGVNELDARFNVPAGATSTPAEILTADGKGVDLYKLATFMLGSVQALAAKVDGLDTRMVSLETRVDALESGAVSSSSSTTTVSSSASALASALESFGVLIEKGIAQFNTLVFRQLVASSDADGTSSAGSISILAGNTIAQVNNALVKPSTKVFVTFNAQIAGGWWVSDKAAGSFRVVLSEPQVGDVSFDYFLVQTEGALAASAPEAASGASGSSPASPDHTPPTITLLGDNPLNVPVGGAFVEPGVQVTDDSGSVNPVVIYVDGVQQDASTAIIDTASAATHIITYAATDAAGNLSTAQRSVVVGSSDAGAGGSLTSSAPADTTPPVVTLNGDAAMQLAVGDSFTDPGATAADETDGDLTAGIVVTGSVDTATEGLYTLTYTAADAAGNSGSASRVVTVVAPPAP